MRICCYLWPIALALAPIGALGDDIDTEAQAKKAFDDGVALFNTNQYEEAVAAFRKAYALRPSWTLLFNIAQGEAAAKRYGLAFETFEAYLAEAGDEITEERRKEVVAELNRLEVIVGALALTAPADAEVRLDGIKRGVTPLPGKLKIAAGKLHVLSVSKDGQVLVEREIKVNRGDVVHVEVALPSDHGAPKKPAPTPATDPAPETRPTRTERNNPLLVGGFTAIGVGGATLIGGVVTGSIALGRNRELNDTCPEHRCSSSERDTILGRDLLALSSTILLSVGGVVAAAGTALVLYTALRKERREAKDRAISISPVVLADGAGVTLNGRF